MPLPRLHLLSVSNAIERLHEVEDELHEEAGRGEKELDKCVSMILFRPLQCC